MEKFLSTQEVAALLGYDHGTVLKWCRTGQIPAYFIGRRYRVSEQALGAWLESKVKVA